MRLRVFSAFNALVLMVAAVVTYAVPMSAAADGTVTWNGVNGWPNSSCNNSPTSMLWIFNAGQGDTVTSVTLHWDSGQHADGSRQANGSWHITTAFFDPLDPANAPVTLTYIGDLGKNPVLTISGCNEGGGGQSETLTTEIHMGTTDTDTGSPDVVSGSIADGSTVHDSATIDNFTGSLPAGSFISFAFWDNGTCDGDAVDSSGGFDVGGTNAPSVVDPGLVEGPLGPGDYAFKAYFTSGDTGAYLDEQSDCEPFSVGAQQAATADISTEIHMNADDTGGTTVAGASVDLGSTVHDSATIVTNPVGVSIPDGSKVTFYWFSGDDTCNGGDLTGLTGTDFSVSGTDRTVDPALPKGPLGAGSYSYIAVFTSSDTDVVGDNASDCEPLTVNQGDSSPKTGVVREDDNSTVADGAGLPLGTSVHDTATIDGQASSPKASGTVTYHFFFDATSDPNCDAAKELKTQGTNTWPQDVTVDSNGDVPGSQSTGALGPGYYSFDAHYGGDNNYTANTSPCEPFHIDKKDSSPSTTVIRDDTNATVPDNGTLALGKSVHDTATIGGQVTGFPASGTVKYHFFFSATSDPACAAGKELSTLNSKSWPQTVTLFANGAVPDSQSTGALGAGYYSFDAEYSGDSNYNGATSACEPFRILQGTLNIRTDIHNASHQVVTSVLPGTTVHDTATVSGYTTGFNPTMGNISFKLFTTSDCTGSFTTPANAGNESTYVAKSASFTTGIGFYSYLATFSGDSNYGQATASCEPLASFNGALTPGYWKNHLANSNSKGPFYSADCKSTVSKYGGSCSTNGVWAIQYLPKSLGNFSVSTIVIAAQVFNGMNCSSTTDQDSIGCLAGHLLATKLNLANGSLACPTILQKVADADAFLKGQTVNGVVGINYIGPSGKYTLTSAQRALAITLKNAFDKYNNGGGC